VVNFLLAGDSWAMKGWTEQNWKYHTIPRPEDVRIADHWPWTYDHCFSPGQGNISCMQKIKGKNIDCNIPIIWIFTEPGRDYNLITGQPEFEWIESENIFEIRKKLEIETFQRIKDTIKNPIGFIGGLSDVNEELTQYHGFTVLHSSWQRWIAETLKSQWFKFGWGACDIGWRADYNKVKPSKSSLFAWDEQIKEWCWWEEHGYFCHEHPTPKANKEFAIHLQPTVEKWLNSL
jgi:hypothetical protein